MNEPFNFISGGKNLNKISVFSLWDPQQCWRMLRAGCPTAVLLLPYQPGEVCCVIRTAALKLTSASSAP